MGLFGPSKTKITPTEFIKIRVDEFFSPKFIDAETAQFSLLSKEVAILREVNLEEYLRERQNVVCRLFQMAWHRTTPHDIFIEYGSVMENDPRVAAIYTGAYDRILSRAQEAGMDTFGFISTIFIAQIIPRSVDANNPDYKNLYIKYGTDFTSLYLFFEALIKRHKFVK